MTFSHSPTHSLTHSRPLGSPPTPPWRFGLVFFLGFSSDWPQWGGQSLHNMYSPAKGLPDALGTIEFKPGTDGEVQTKGVKNLKWVAKIGSQSYGNVTVAAGKVFIGTNNENPRDPRHQE